MAMLAVPDQLARKRGLAPQRAAQLAHDGLRKAFIDVHPLARERRAPAVRASVAVGLQGADTAPQQDSLELLDVGVCFSGGHAPALFAVRACAPASIASLGHSSTQPFDGRPIG